jgi:ABC-2 type transport system permease protein
MTTAFRMELRRMRALVGWLAVVAVAYGGIVAAFYPTFRDNQQMIEQYMGLFPKEMLSIFGMEGSLADPGNFFNMYVGGMLWPIVAAVAAIVLATRPVAADLERGFLELAISTPLSRVRYLGAAIGGQLVAIALLALATVGGILVVGWAFGAPFDAGRFLLAAIVAFGFGITLAGVTTLLSVLTLDRGRAAGIATGLLLGTYLLDAASKVWTGIGGLATLSPFAHLQTRPIIDSGTFPIGDFLLFVVVATAAWGASLLLFRRRDLAA